MPKEGLLSPSCPSEISLPRRRACARGKCGRKLAARRGARRDLVRGRPGTKLLVDCVVVEWTSISTKSVSTVRAAAGDKDRINVIGGTSTRQARADAKPSVSASELYSRKIGRWLDRAHRMPRPQSNFPFDRVAMFFRPGGRRHQSSHVCDAEVLGARARLWAHALVNASPLLASTALCC